MGGLRLPLQLLQTVCLAQAQLMEALPALVVGTETLALGSRRLHLSTLDSRPARLFLVRSSLWAIIVDAYE